jgi:hypothetical protein
VINLNRTFHLLRKPDIFTCYEHSLKEVVKAARDKLDGKNNGGVPMKDGAPKETILELFFVTFWPACHGSEPP